MVGGLAACGGGGADPAPAPVTADTLPEAPVLTLTSPADGQAVTPAEDGSVTIAGTVTDTRDGAALTVTSGGQSAEVAEDGSFTLTLTPGADSPAVTLVASDGVNRVSAAVPIAGREAAPTWAMPEITNAECILDQGACFVDGDTPDVNEDGSVFTLRGSYPAGGTIGRPDPVAQVPTDRGDHRRGRYLRRRHPRAHR